MKKYSTSFAIMEMQIKITLQFHFTLVRMASTKKTTANAGEGVGAAIMEISIEVSQKTNILSCYTTF
jgi:hypothetical protein